MYLGKKIVKGLKRKSYVHRVDHKMAVQWHTINGRNGNDSTWKKRKTMKKVWHKIFYVFERIEFGNS